MMEVVERTVILTCAATGGSPISPKYPAELQYPVAPEDIAQAGKDASDAGASIVHFHARDPETTTNSIDPDLFARICDRYRELGGDALINVSCGGGAEFLPDPTDESRGLPESCVLSAEERAAHLERARADICSIDVTTANLDEGGGEYVYLSTPRTLRSMADRIRDLGVKPEIEIYHPGDIRLATQMLAEGHFDAPPMFQFVLGARWANPCDTPTILYLRYQLPAGASWAAFGISSMQMPAVAQTAVLGGHVRVGLEDNVYLRRGEFATNAQLVERATAIIESLGGRVATPEQARDILEIPQR